MMVVEVVKLVQAALALWGLFGTDREDLDINGLFCDETKAGIFKWRHMMGMEKETLKLEVRVLQSRVVCADGLERDERGLY
jgi:hypothetical protein